MRTKLIKVNQSILPSPIGQPSDLKELISKTAQHLKDTRIQGSRYYTFISFFQDWENEIAETIYAVRYCKRKSKNTQEKCVAQLVYVGTPSRSWVSGNLLFSRLSGYYVLWEKGDSKSGFFKAYGYDPRLYASDSEEWRPNVGIYDVKDPIEKEAEILSLRNFPKYFDVYAMMNDCSTDDILHYVRQFNEGSSLELLQKAGISYLWESKYLIRAKGKKRKRILSFIRNNIEEIKETKPQISHILVAMNNDIPLAQYDWFMFVNRIKKLLCGEGGFFTEEEAEEVGRYLKKQNRSPIHYLDYLRLSAEIGRDTHDRGVRYPRDFHEQFEQLSAISREIRQKTIDEQIDIQLKKLGLPFEWSDTTLTIRIIDTVSKLIEMGKSMQNCVGCGIYGSGMANGEIVILGVFKDGKPVNCVEILVPGFKKNGVFDKRHFQVLQNLGRHNVESEYQNQAERIVGSYVEKANKIWQRSHSQA